MAKSDREIFESFLFDMIEGRHELVAAVLSNDVVWHLPLFAKQPPMAGRDAVLRFLSAGPEGIYEPGSLRIQPVGLAAEDGFASCLATITATTANGMPYENSYGFFARIRDGKLIEVWELVDGVTFQEQLRARPEG